MSTAAAHSSPLTSLRVIAADIKIAHSVFALPFAVLAAFMAASPMAGEASASSIAWPRFAGQLTLIVLAMVLARTVAMLANRLLDRRIDEANPRTADRAIPSGRLSPGAAGMTLLACVGGFMVVCVSFGVLYDNYWPTWLGLPVLAWLSAYPLLKRYTALCHVYLGSSLAISPLAAAIAIDPWQLSVQPALWLLAAMVLCWVAGFDIIYALQDVDIDRREGLHSIPAKLGTSGALWVSRCLHAAAVVCLLAAWRLDPRLGAIFAVGVIIVITLLLIEHLTVAKRGTKRIALTFFTLNGIISCVLGALGVVDIVTT